MTDRARQTRRRKSPVLATFFAVVSCTAVGLVAGQDQASEPRLLAYFPFDGGSVEESARGLKADIVVAGEVASDGFGIVSDSDQGPRGDQIGEVDPNGRYGEALAFTDASHRVLVPLDLDFGTHPQITVSMWVKIHGEVEGERGVLLSTGRGADHTPGLSLQDGHVVADAVGGRLHNYAADLRVGEWNHVAAIWDSEANRVRVYTGGLGDERTAIRGFDPDTIAARGRNHSALENPLHPDWLPTRHLVLGALGIGGSREVRGVSLDEVRIWSGALTEEALSRIMKAETPPPLGTVAPPPPPPAVAEDETIGGLEDDRWDDPAEEEPEEERGDLIGWELSDGYQLSGVSGSTGESTTRAEFSGPGTENAYATGMEVWEKGNRPCMLIVEPQVQGERAPTVSPYSDCDATDASLQLRVPMTEPVTKLQVCQNRRNERLKGLRLTARNWEMGSGDLLFLEETEQEDEAPNCNGNWQETVACPAGSVASGAVAHWDVEGSGGILTHSVPKAQLVGLQLVCREMVGVYR